VDVFVCVFGGCEGGLKKAATSSLYLTSWSGVYRTVYPYTFKIPTPGGPIPFRVTNSSADHLVP